MHSWSFQRLDSEPKPQPMTLAQLDFYNLQPVGACYSYAQGPTL